MNDPTAPALETVATTPAAVAEAPVLHVPAIAAATNPSLVFELDQLFKSTLVSDDALGRIKQLGVQIAHIQHPAPQTFDGVVLEDPQLVIFAADHGVSDEGVSAHPQEATRQRVLQILRGKGSVNAMAEMHDVQVTVVDAGVASHLLPPEHGKTAVPLLLRKIAYGTRNMMLRPAMSMTQAVAALHAGMDVVQHLPGNVIALGDVGVGSTSCAALLLARLCGVPAADAYGPGSGLDDAQLRVKLEVLQNALMRHRKATDPLDVLASLGGFEIAMMVGAMLQAASERRVIVVDGFVAAAAALVARSLSPHVMDYLVFSHRSTEPGHRLLLIHLQVQPLLDMELRMGQGMGAMLAWPLLKAAERILQEG
jgi:nicotinate-nucleotide--dimethylbenzimidazole phosphoribosyltransferase